MLPTIRLSISEVQNQLHTGQQDTRTYFSDTAEPERNTNATLATATATIATTTTDRIGPRRTDFRHGPQQTRNQPATTSTNIRRSRYHDIRNYLSGDIVAVTTKHAMQSATEEPITPTDYIFSRCRDLRNRLQPPRTQVTQDTAEEPTTSTVNTFSSLRALHNRFEHLRPQETQAPTEEPTTSTLTVVPSLVYAQCATDFSQHEPSQVRLQSTPGGSSQGATVPVRFNGVSLTN
jgi:hypothetical protein